MARRPRIYMVTQKSQKTQKLFIETQLDIEGRIEILEQRLLGIFLA